jgi:hypothetical protein
MSKVTFGYIVGGDDKHYINLMRSLKALEERVKQPYEVVIIDMDDRFYADDANIKVVKQDAKHLCLFSTVPTRMFILLWSTVQSISMVLKK